MVTKATYAVIGDLHEVVPAINAEIRRRARLSPPSPGCMSRSDSRRPVRLPKGA